MNRPITAFFVVAFLLGCMSPVEDIRAASLPLRAAVDGGVSSCNAMLANPDVTRAAGLAACPRAGLASPK